MERATKMQQRLALSATDQISTNSYHFLITSKQREYDIEISFLLFQSKQDNQMKISARNCLEGTVVAINEGPVSTEVTIETPAGEKIVSSITTTSAKNLGLKVGDKAYAVIKASNVMIAVED